nr:MAG TPA: hypothetical protein [Caudoviricetes sp.]
MAEEKTVLEQMADTLREIQDGLNEVSRTEESLLNAIESAIDFFQIDFSLDELWSMKEIQDDLFRSTITAIDGLIELAENGTELSQGQVDNVLVATFDFISNVFSTVKSSFGGFTKYIDNFKEGALTDNQTLSIPTKWKEKGGIGGGANGVFSVFV